MDDLKYWLGFSAIEGLGAVSIKKIRSFFNSMKEAWNASGSDYCYNCGLNSSLVERIISQKQTLCPDKLYDKLIKSKINALCLDDKDYPFLLKQIYDAPAVIYYKGNFQNIDFNHTIAMVGTRIPSEYGRQAAYKIGGELANLGITLVSGLAEGIDTAVHMSCIQAGSKTIAVLGSGLNIIYPKINKSLAERITDNDNGIIISEYPPDSRPEAWKFPQRNRIISGLSSATIVVESKERGGSLITAKYALEQNREILGVPSRVFDEHNRGVHNLLLNDQAELFTNVENLVNTLNWEPVKNKITAIPQDKVKLPEDKPINKAISAKVEMKNKPKTVITKDITKSELKEPVNKTNEESLILEILTNEPIKFDDILLKTELNAPRLLGIITMLELKGLVRQLPGKRYIKG